jgi:hypothetical protein
MSTVCLHIGSMKSGTTFVQRTLTRNKQLLLENGCLFPGERWREQVSAVHDVTGASARGRPGKPGAWDALVGEVLSYGGDTVVISMEGLCVSDAATARRVVESFRGCQVRVVLTARDLGRVVPAQWQESIKNGATVDFGRYLALASLPGARRMPKAGSFWRLQDISRILRTWQPLVDPQNPVLVTVPQRPASAGLLWDRFRRATLLPDIGADLNVRRNDSLGAYSVEVVRLVNELLEVRERREYREVVKHSLADVLARRGSSEPPIEVPPAYRSWIARTAEKLVGEVIALGPEVVGTTDDLLVPGWKDHPGGRLTALFDGSLTTAKSAERDAQVLAAAVDAIAGLVLMVERGRGHS